MIDLIPAFLGAVMTWRDWALWLFAFLLGTGLALGPWITGKARGHSYYSTACCDKSDCKVIPRHRVRLITKGYIVDERWEFTYAETQPAPADEYSICQISPEIRPRCFYAPPGSS